MKDPKLDASIARLEANTPELGRRLRYLQEQYESGKLQGEEWAAAWVAVVEEFVPREELLRIVRIAMERRAEL